MFILAALIVAGALWWSGQQIVPATWVEQSIVPRFQAIDYFGGLFFYGYHWWLGRTLSGSQEVTWIAAVRRHLIHRDADLFKSICKGCHVAQKNQNALPFINRYILCDSKRQVRDQESFQHRI